jgi:hypothetical protein
LKKLVEDPTPFLQQYNQPVLRFLESLTEHNGSERGNKQRPFILLLVLEILHSLHNNNFIGDMQHCLTSVLWTITHSKKAITLLNRMGIGSSYSTVHGFTNEVSKQFLDEVKDSILVPKTGVSVIVFDNIQKICMENFKEYWCKNSQFGNKLDCNHVRR